MILITGASQGIGRFLFEEYLKRKEQLHGTYLSTLPDKNLQHLFTRVDVSDYRSVETWIDNIRPVLSRIILINCAARSFKSFTHKSDPEEWRKVIEVNLIGTYNVVRCLLPIMREQGFGRIINFSSVVSLLPTPGVSAYAASKSALTGFAKSVAIENGSKGITINNITMGYADLGMSIRDVPGDFLKGVLKRIPDGKLCKPEDIFKTVQLLVETDYMNGSSIDLNGGLI